MALVKTNPSSVRLLGYSKTIIPTRGHATLHFTHRGKPYDVVVQVIPAENYYALLLGLANSTRMGILNYDFDAVNQLQAFSTASVPPLDYPHLFEGLGELGDPLSLTLNPTIKPIQVAPPRYAALRLPTIKDALDKLIHTGQLVQVKAPNPWISSMVVRERPATARCMLLVYTAKKSHIIWLLWACLKSDHIDIWREVDICEYVTSLAKTFLTISRS